MLDADFTFTIVAFKHTLHVFSRLWFRLLAVVWMVVILFHVQRWNWIMGLLFRLLGYWRYFLILWNINVLYGFGKWAQVLMRCLCLYFYYAFYAIKVSLLELPFEGFLNLGDEIFFSTASSDSLHTESDSLILDWNLYSFCIFTSLCVFVFSGGSW